MQNANSNTMHIMHHPGILSKWYAALLRWMHFFQGCREYFQNISFPLLQMELRPHAYYNELQQSYGRCFFMKPTFPTAFWFWKLWWLFENQFKTGLKFWQWVFRQYLIRDGKRFYLKWNNIFFQHHFRSKTIYFSIFSTPILWQSECP